MRKFFFFLTLGLLVHISFFTSQAMAAPLSNPDKYVTFCNHYKKYDPTTQCVSMSLSRFLTLIASPGDTSSDAYSLIGASDAFNQANPSYFTLQEYKDSILPIIQDLKSDNYYVYITNYNEGMTVYIGKKDKIDALGAVSLWGKPGTEPYKDYVYLAFYSCTFVSAGTNICQSSNNSTNLNQYLSSSVYLAQDFTTASSYDFGSNSMPQPLTPYGSTSGPLYTNHSQYQNIAYSYTPTLPAFSSKPSVPTFDMSKFLIPLEVCDGNILENFMCNLMNFGKSFINFFIGLIIPSEELLNKVFEGSDLLQPFNLQQGVYDCNLPVFNTNVNLCTVATMKDNSIFQTAQKLVTLAVLLWPIGFIINKTTRRTGASKL